MKRLEQRPPAGTWLIAALAVPAAAAGETVTYTYDALGRLTAVSTAGGPNGGAAAATGYDPAGNRTSYSHDAGGAEALAAPAPAAAAGALESGPDAAAGPVEGVGEPAPSDFPTAIDMPDEAAPPGPADPGQAVPDEEVQAAEPEAAAAAGARR